MTIDKPTTVLAGLMASSLALLSALSPGYDLPGGHGSLRTLTRGVNSGAIWSRIPRRFLASCKVQILL